MYTLQESNNVRPQLGEPALNLGIPLSRKHPATHNDAHHDNQHLAPGSPPQHPIALQRRQRLQTRRDPFRQRAENALVRGGGQDGAPPPRLARGVDEEVLRLDHKERSIQPQRITQLYIARRPRRYTRARVVDGEDVAGNPAGRSGR